MAGGACICSWTGWLIIRKLKQYSAFSQLYVAASRVGNPDHIKFALREKRLGGDYNWTPNVVYKDALLHCHSSQDEGERRYEDTLASRVIHVYQVTEEDYEGPYDSVLEDCEEQEVDFNPRRRITKQQGVPASRSASLPKNVTPLDLTQPEEWHPTVDEPPCEYEKIREANITEREVGCAALNAHHEDVETLRFKRWVLTYIDSLINADIMARGMEYFEMDGFMEFLKRNGEPYTEVKNNSIH